MRIKVLLNLGAGLPKFRQDEVHEVSDDVGAMLIRQHWAVLLPPAPSPVEVAEEPPTPQAAALPDESPAVLDKFEELRQHPDHLTKKSRSPRKRAHKTTDQTET